MVITTDKSNQAFGDMYAKAVGELPGASEQWINGHRQESFDIIRSGGLPNQKDEAWKYTSLNTLVNTSFIPAARADDVDVTHLPVTLPLIGGAVRVVLVNGAFRDDLSQGITLENSQGRILMPLAEVFDHSPAYLKPILGTVAKPGKSAIAALNTSYMEDGLLLKLGDSMRLDNPIHVVSIGASGAHAGSFHPRIEVKLGRDAQATLVESHIGLPGQPYLSNALSEIDVGEHARLNHYVIVSEDSDAFHLGRSDIHVASDGQYNSFVLSMGGALVRREAHVTFGGIGATARVDGAYGISGSQHSDIHSEIMHCAPSTSSTQTIKGVLAGKSHGVFQGCIHVAKEGKGTDGRQLHKALLLNQGPEVNCKPELEIYAEDVQCAHGATTGELDEHQLFYLLSRGIDEAKARALLIEGFLDDVVLKVEHQEAQQLILETVKNWLAAQTALFDGA